MEAPTTEPLAHEDLIVVTASKTKHHLCQRLSDGGYVVVATFTSSYQAGEFKRMQSDLAKGVAQVRTRLSDAAALRSQLDQERAQLEAEKAEFSNAMAAMRKLAPVPNDNVVDMGARR